MANAPDNIKLNQDTDSGFYVTFQANGKPSHFLTFLADYNSKDDFMESVRADITEEGGDPNVFKFVDLPENLVLMKLITENDVNPVVWNILKIEEDEDINILAAYISLTNIEINNADDIIATLDKAKEAYTGNYNRRPDWAYNYLEQMGAMEGLNPIIANNLDIDSIAAELMMSNNIKVAETETGHFYFSGV